MSKKDSPDPRHIDQIAYRLKLTRTVALEIGQTELCALVGIKTNTYNQWEMGKGRPELDKAMLLCEALGYTLDWIYRGDPAGLPYAIASKIAPYGFGLPVKHLSLRA